MRNKLFGNINFVTSSLSILLNFFFSTFLLIILSLFGFFHLAAEIGITVSFTLFVCQIFSANHRSLIYLKNYQSKINQIIQFRLFISIFIILISIIVIISLNFKNIFFLSLLSILICSQWVIEILLTNKEKSQENNFLNKTLAFNLIFIFVFTIIIFFNLLNLINFLMVLIVVTNLFTWRKEILQKKLYIFDTKLLSEIFILSIKNIEILSSFSINFANLIWRLSIFGLSGKSTAGLLFGSYALGSFFGTIYSNILAPKIHSKKKIPLRKIIILFSPLIILLFYYALIEFKSLENTDNINTLRVSCILFSIVGSFFMIFSLIMRFNYFYNVEAKHIFKLDIFYSFLISILIITVFLTLGSKYLVMAYFFASICSLATYSSLYLRK